MSEQENELSNDKKIFCYTISFISLIFSIFVLFVSFKKIKMTITNILIMQIIMAEILDGINMILAIGIDAKGSLTFENYPSRMGFCFTQIYLGVFSCLWNLFCSLFISIRIFDRMQNQNKIFKHKFMYEYTTTISYGIPSLITFILWSSQVSLQSKNVQNKTYEDTYETKNINTFFRYMYCWVGGWTNIVLFILSFLLILANFYFSIIRSALFIRRISKDIEDTEESVKGSQSKVAKIKKIMLKLILYPVVSGVVWTIYFILQILTNGINDRDTNQSLANSMKYGAGAWCLILIICIRQIVFTLVFFLTQENLRKHAKNYITCKYCSKTKIEYKSISEPDSDEPNQLLNDKERDTSNKDE